MPAILETLQSHYIKTIITASLSVVVSLVTVIRFVSDLVRSTNIFVY